MRVESRLRWAALLVAAGLLVQLLCLVRIHPLSFISFLVIGCPLLGAGIALYLSVLFVRPDWKDRLSEEDASEEMESAV